MNQQQKNAWYDAQRAQQQAEAARQRRVNEDFARARDQQAARRAEEGRALAQQEQARRTRENNRIMRENLARMSESSPPRSRSAVPKFSATRSAPSDHQDTGKVAPKQGSFLALAVFILILIWLFDARRFASDAVLALIAVGLLAVLYKMRFFLAKVLRFTVITAVVLGALYFLWQGYR